MKMRVMIIVVSFLLLNGTRVSAQANELAQLALNIEKLSQLKSILKSLQTSYSVLSKGYSSIKNISEGNFNLHKIFLDGLMEVSPAVREYRKVPMIIEYQVMLIREFKQANSVFRRSGNFSARELEYMYSVYQNLLRLSLRNLDELLTITTGGKVRMSDDERLAAIDRIFEEMEDKVTFLREFNRDNSFLSLQRKRERTDIDRLKVLQGIE